MSTKGQKEKAKSRIIILDFETGGLKPSVHAIVSFAAVAVEPVNFEIVDRLEFKVKPYEMEYTPEAQRVHGLSKAHLEKHGVKYETGMKAIHGFFEKNKTTKAKKPILAGHNLDFDKGFLEFNFEVMDYDLPKSIDPYYIDTLKECEMIYGHKKDVSMKLVNVCGMMGINLDDAHSAMADVIATYELLRQITMLKRSIVDGSNGVINNTEERKYQRYQF